MRALVLLNRGGRRMAQDGDALVEQLRDAFARHRVDAELRLLDGRELAEAARLGRRAHDTVVVGGGDGSVGCVAGALVDSDVPLGLVPLGTLNHFARDLGVPQEVDAAVGLIAAGRTRRIDVADVNGRVFVNNSSIGVYPYVVAERDRQRDDGRAKWPAMALAAWHALRHYRHRLLGLEIAGRTAQRRTPLLFVGNNEYALEFPEMGARPRLDGGTLGVYLVRGSGPRAIPRLLLRAFLRRIDADRDFERIEGLTTLTVHTRDSRTQVALDGEVLTLATPLVYRLRPRALAVYAAPPAPAPAPAPAPVQSSAAAGPSGSASA